MTNMRTLTSALNKIAGVDPPVWAAAKAANLIAGTNGLALVGALNAAAGTHGYDLGRVLNTLAGTTGLTPERAAMAWLNGYNAPITYNANSTYNDL